MPVPEWPPGLGSAQKEVSPDPAVGMHVGRKEAHWGSGHRGAGWPHLLALRVLMGQLIADDKDYRCTGQQRLGSSQMAREPEEDMGSPGGRRAWLTGFPSSEVRGVFTPEPQYRLWNGASLRCLGAPRFWS